MKDRQLKIKQRKLPHSTIKDAVYFVTFTFSEGALSNPEKEIVFEHILSGKDIYYDLLTFVVMPDHVHAVFNLIGNYELKDVMKGMKGVSSHLINKTRGKTGINWIHESFDRIIRNKEELDNVIIYIHQNPFEAGLVEDGNDYSYYYFNENWRSEK
ncbi:MAG: transposase [Candidatus Marinimicrobia bacterium]|nr:transposase [Candidatus Neomarinimicrobiota bacterium]